MGGKAAQERRKAARLAKQNEQQSEKNKSPAGEIKGVGKRGGFNGERSPSRSFNGDGGKVGKRGFDRNSKTSGKKVFSKQKGGAKHGAPGTKPKPKFDTSPKVKVKKPKHLGRKIEQAKKEGDEDKLKELEELAKGSLAEKAKKVEKFKEMVVKQTLQHYKKTKPEMEEL
ncbi:hypothetical protein TrRE_jg9344, partial [Triparma retinervis]